MTKTRGSWHKNTSQFFRGVFFHGLGLAGWLAYWLVKRIDHDISGRDWQLTVFELEYLGYTKVHHVAKVAKSLSGGYSRIPPYSPIALFLTLIV